MAPFVFEEHNTTSHSSFVTVYLSESSVPSHHHFVGFNPCKIIGEPRNSRIGEHDFFSIFSNKGSGCPCTEKNVTKKPKKNKKISFFLGNVTKITLSQKKCHSFRPKKFQFFFILETKSQKSNFLRFRFQKVQTF